jgi:uncharacterized protein YecT (DUF1311 family)
MRMSLTIASLLLSFQAIAVCQRNEHGSYEDIACAADAVSVARKEMETVYERVLKLARPDAKQALREAQQSWERYRTAVSRFTYAQEGDGSSGRLVVTNDTERALRARTLELKQWLPR